MARIALCQDIMVEYMGFMYIAAALKQEGHTVDVIAHSKPEAKVFKKGTHQSLRAMICGACGYVEFFIKEPREFYAKYREKKAT